jgi:HAD superfamily hydrolase (TIGR01549 family)
MLNCKIEKTTSENPFADHLLEVFAGLNHDISDLRPEIVEILSRSEMINIEDTVLWPDTIETLQTLKDMGVRLAVLSNSHNPTRMRKIIEEHYIDHFFEVIIISGEVGEQKPSAGLIHGIMEELQATKAFMVGDMVTKDILGANMAGIHGLWMNIHPKCLNARSIKAINEQHVDVDHSLFGLSQIPSVVANLEARG